jgi:hypothetical protein
LTAGTDAQDADSSGFAEEEDDDVDDAAPPAPPPSPACTVEESGSRQDWSGPPVVGTPVAVRREGPPLPTARATSPTAAMTTPIATGSFSFCDFPVESM